MLSDWRGRCGAAVSSSAPNTLLNILLQKMRAEGCPGLCTSASGMVSRFLSARLVLLNSPAAGLALAHSDGAS